MTLAYNTDCLEFMKGLKDNEFDLAIVDPPYGIGASCNSFIRKGKQTGKSLCKSGIKYESKQWDSSPPSIDFFNELKRISKNQIIWGANHFISRIPFDSSCWIVWDKKTGENLYADCELAYTSFTTAVRKFEYMWKGMFQENMKNKEARIHPTQKPVALYKWLLQNYAKKGDRILDTHLGSGSSRIACHDMGFDFVGLEIDKDYFEAQEKRFKAHSSQSELFAFDGGEVVNE